jgi:hypothetical protein
MSSAFLSERVDVHRRVSLAISNWENPDVGEPRTKPRPISDASPSFRSRFGELKKRLGLKQIWLAMEIGCSAAAISYWTSGARLPSTQNLRRILEALARGGASSNEVVALGHAWSDEMTKRTDEARRIPTNGTSLR